MRRRRANRLCILVGLAGLSAIPHTAPADIFLPPAIDGDFRDWEPDGSPVTAVACANRIYLRISLPEAVVLQSGSGVVIYYDTDDNAATGLSAHGLGAEVRWDAGTRSGMRYLSESGVVTGRSIRHADLGLRAAPVLDSRDFELSILRAEAGGGTCRVAVEHRGEFLGNALAVYRETRVVRSLSPARAPYTDVRVAAYNVLDDDLLDRLDKKDAFLAEFAALQPDVVCLSEV